jgi:hypothetical protein
MPRSPLHLATGAEVPCPQSLATRLLRHPCRLTRRWLAVVALAQIPAIAAALPALSQAIDPATALRNPAVQEAVSTCNSDRSRLCSSVMPGGGRIVRCLVEKRESVSPPCQAAILKARDALVAAGVPGAETLPR